MSSPAEQAVRQVVAALPELLPMLSEHLEDNFGQMLPHLFFWDVTQWAEAKAEKDSPEVGTLVSLAERLYAQGDPAVQNLLVVSFLEDVTPGSALEGRLRYLRELVDNG